MSYCSQCGKEMPSGARFCPDCGSPVVSMPTSSQRKTQSHTAESQMHTAKPQSRTTKTRGSVNKDDMGSKVLTGLNIALMVVLFLPWLRLDIGLGAESYNLLAFATYLFNFNDALSSSLGTAYSSTTVAGSYFGWASVLLAAWVINFGCLVISITCCVKKTGTFTAIGGGATILASVVGLYCVSGINETIFNKMYIIGDPLSITAWPVIALVLGIGVNVYARMRKYQTS